MYKLVKKDGEVVCISKTIGNKIIVMPMVESNKDYQEYLKWVAEGNTPEPADSGE